MNYDELVHLSDRLMDLCGELLKQVPEEDLDALHVHMNLAATELAEEDVPMYMAAVEDMFQRSKR